MTDIHMHFMLYFYKVTLQASEFHRTYSLWIFHNPGFYRVN